MKYSNSVTNRKEKTRRMTLFAMLLTLELLLILTPLGFIPLGPISATTLHIPVILCGILMGPVYGGVLGLVFGLSSLIKNTITPLITSFVFSPFVSIGGIQGNIWSVWIAIGPRILLGVIAAYLFSVLSKRLKHKTLTVGITAGISTFLHTLMVMGSIYLFFGPQYAQANNITPQALLSVIAGVIFVNGIGEIIVSIIIAIAVYKVTWKLIDHRKVEKTRS